MQPCVPYSNYHGVQTKREGAPVLHTHQGPIRVEFHLILRQPRAIRFRRTATSNGRHPRGRDLALGQIYRSTVLTRIIRSRCLFFRRLSSCKSLNVYRYSSLTGRSCFLPFCLIREEISPSLYRDARYRHSHIMCPFEIEKTYPYPDRLSYPRNIRYIFEEIE